MADNDVLGGVEFLGGAEDLDEEVATIRGAAADCPRVVERDRKVARFCLHGFIHSRQHEVLAAAQHERGEGSRVGDQGGGGRDGWNHEGRQRCAL